MTLTNNLGIYQQAGASGQASLIEEQAPLVKKIALHLMARLPASVQLEDLIQAGMIGLLEAAQRYSSAKGATFETYAGIRIRGAMVDEIRKGDWVPRSVHRNARRISQAIKAVEDREGREAQ
ncbi:sigma-70 family RNA polymerase sigma factor, partial [Marinobacter alexandrii]